MRLFVVFGVILASILCQFTYYMKLENFKMFDDEIPSSDVKFSCSKLLF